MLVLRSEADLRPFHGCALVPTMGALHEGHCSLVRQAAATGLRVVATIFVNPTQFGPKEDFARYPRTLESDLKLAEAAGAQAVFCPDVATMYPAGAEAARAEAEAWPLPEVGRMPGLEDACRPGHFGGVCQVVARLFDLAQPAVAIFGQKDYQQLRVLADLVRDCAPRWGALQVLDGPTVREPDGLAMSSRNRYMQGDERTRALALHRALQRATSHASPADAERTMAAVLAENGLLVDYAVVRDARTLLAPQEGREARALIAARLGAVRLIDNAPWNPAP
jgi:pantoate--beta-alanine ligase